MKKHLLQSIYKSLVDEPELWSVDDSYVIYKKEEGYSHTGEIKIYTGYSFKFENPSQIELNMFEKYKLKKAINNMIVKKLIDKMKKK